MSDGYIGHPRQHAELESRAYPVSVLTGPESVGKQTLVDHVLAAHSQPAPSVLRIGKLTADEARKLTFAAPRMRGTGIRHIIIDLDNSLQENQNRLLRLLEDPSRGVSFYLIASGPVLPTILSRARLLRFGLLTTDEVRQVLILRGMDPLVAERQAPVGRGQVRFAILGTDPDVRTKVMAVLRALEARDAAALDTAVGRWGHEDSLQDRRAAAEAYELLGRWASEAVTGRWRVFEPGSAPKLSREDARKLWVAMARFPAAHPRTRARGLLAALVLT